MKQLLISSRSCNRSNLQWTAHHCIIEAVHAYPSSPDSLSSSFPASQWSCRTCSAANAHSTTRVACLEGPLTQHSQLQSHYQALTLLVDKFSLRRTCVTSFTCQHVNPSQQRPSSPHANPKTASHPPSPRHTLCFRRLT